MNGDGYGRLEALGVDGKEEQEAQLMAAAARVIRAESEGAIKERPARAAESAEGTCCWSVRRLAAAAVGRRAVIADAPRAV